MRGTMSIWRSMSCTERMTWSVWSCESVENAIATRCAPYSRTSAGRSSVDPMNGIFPLVAAMRSSRSTKPTTRSPYSECFSILSASRRATYPEPTMMTFWMYADWRRPMVRDDRAQDRHEDDREEPEDDEPPEVRIREPGEVRQNEEAPCSERHDLDDADDVVNRGMVRALLVAVVEPVHAREQHPERDAWRRRARSPSRARPDQPVRQAPRPRRQRRTTSQGRRRRRAAADGASASRDDRPWPGCVYLMKPPIALCDGDRVLGYSAQSSILPQTAGLPPRCSAHSPSGTKDSHGIARFLGSQTDPGPSSGPGARRPTVRTGDLHLARSL